MNSLDGLRATFAPSWQRSSLRTYLVGVILLSTVPVAVLLSYQVYAGLRGQHERQAAELRRSAGALARIVERELAATSDALTSAVSGVRGDDLDGLRAALGRLPPERRGWRGVFVLDAAGAPQLDSQGASAAVPLRPAFTAEELRRPPPVLVSTLADGPAGEALTAVAVPVRRDGLPVHFVGAWIAGAEWARLLREMGLPADGEALLFDQHDGAIAASTPAAQAASGPASAAAAPAALRSGRELRQASLAGADTLAAWRRVDPGGWGVAVAMPADAIDAHDRRAFGIAMTTTAACMLLGLSLGLLLARRLIQPLDALSSGGPALAVRPSAILEIERLRERLLAAHARSEAAMARLESKATEFQTLFDSSPVGLTFAQDRDCRVVVHNPAMKALFGPVPGGRSAPATVRYEGEPLRPGQQPLHRAATSGQPVGAMELQIDSGDGRPTVVLVHAVPLRDAGGRPRGAIEAAVDITGRKEDERRLMEADDRLRENQHLIDLAQEAGHVGFFSYDFERGSATWSPGQARLFGLDAGADATMTPAGWLQRVDAGHRGRLEALLRQMLLLGQEKETFDYRLLHESGGSRWMSSRVLVQYHAHGSPKHMTGVTVDVSRHKELEIERALLVEQEQAARQQAEAANRAKDEILAMLGHELRNPLGAISSAVEVMQRVDRDGAIASSALEIMARQTANLSRIMDDLLDVAGVISGQVVLARHGFDLASLAGRVVTTMKLTGVDGSHELRVDLQPAWIDADSTRIEQVIVNLLGNAFKYTPAGSRVELSVRRENADAVLRVEDHGSGMPPELLARVFDLFVQGERPLDRRAGGLGVGLTLVRRLVTLHAGTVTAASSERGSSFEVRLAAIDAPTAERSALAPMESRIVARRVVLIEDNLDAAQALRASLELDGHSVRSVGDGVSGLATIVAERPDVAIVDIGLPGLTGFEVALRSRAAGYPGMMIATSGYGQQADTERTRRAGFDAHLIKPVDAMKLRELIAACD